MDSFWDNDTSNDIYSNFGKNLAFVFQNLKNRSLIVDMDSSGDVTFETFKVIKCEEVHAYDFSKSSINKTKEKLSNLDQN